MGFGEEGHRGEVSFSSHGRAGLIVSCLVMDLGHFLDENAFQMRTSR